MKFQFHSFFSGVLVSALVLGGAVSALAISGRMTIEVDPVNLRVNGEVFAPADANGAPVPVFAYNGTTYAPVRALAEAYGLEVGYDAATNMATVVDPEAKPVTTPAPDTTVNGPDYSEWSTEDEAAYQEFKGLWKIGQKEWSDTSNAWAVTATSIRPIDNYEFNKISNIDMLCKRFALEQYENEDALVVIFSSDFVLRVTGMRIDGGELVILP